MSRPKKDIGSALELVAKDLLENNSNVADIGLIIGCLGDDSMTWLEDLKAECTDIDEFIELASKRAHIALISAAAKEAMGYKFKETDRNYKKMADGSEKEINKKVKEKVARPNEQLLRFMLRCRLPEYFTETQKIEINKKTIEIKQIAEDEIRGFGQKLLDAIDAEEA